MRNNWPWILILLCVSATVAKAQSITGRVKGTDGAVLMGASVIVESSLTGDMVCYGITDTDGRFSVTLPSTSKETTGLRLSISYIGYKTQRIDVVKFRNGQTISLPQDDYVLKEVKVKGRRIHQDGDTLTYSVAGFRQGQDRTIADVIAKMPGLEVKSDGSVAYQGKSINKFYIEGLDLMGAQYGVANKNIPVDKVVKVQVIENHQPIKSIRGISFSDQAALNLVLSDNAKATWTAVADIGVGYGDRLTSDDRMMAMMFKKGFQSLLMYKYDNTGKDIRNEINMYLRADREESDTQILRLVGNSVSNMDKKRHTFNDSHLAAGNWLWKTSENSTLRVQGTGYIDETDIESTRATTYMYIDGMPIITEDRNLSNKRSEWKGSMEYQLNADRTFIKNSLSAFMDFNKTTGLTSTNRRQAECRQVYLNGRGANEEDKVNGQECRMMVKPRERWIDETLNISHTSNRKNVVEAMAHIGYNYLPDELLTINGITEDITLNLFDASASLKHKIKAGNLYIDNEIGAEYRRLGMEMSEPADKATYQQATVFWTPAANIVIRSHRIILSAPVKWGRQTYRTSHLATLWCEPQMSYTWTVSPFSTINAYAGIKQKPLEGTLMADMPFFTDYRTQRTGSGRLAMQHTQSVSLGYKFSQPIWGMFFNVRPFFTRTAGNMLYHYSLDDDIYTMTASDTTTVTRNYGVSGSLTKAFGWAKTFIGISARYDKSEQQQLMGTTLSNAKMTRTSVSLDYSMGPARWISFEGNTTVRFTDLKRQSGEAWSAVSTRYWIHSLDVYFYPTKAVMLGIKNSLHDSSQHELGINYFCDISVSYKTSLSEWSLAINNLIGTKTYERINISTTTQSYQLTRLRPRELMLKYSFDL